MELIYENTLDDVVALAQSIHAHSRALQRHRSTARWALPLAMVALFGLLSLQFGDPLLFAAALIAAVIAAVFFPRIYDAFQERLFRKVFGERKREAWAGRRVLAIREDGIEGQHDLGAGLIRWPAVERIVEGRDRVFIHLSNLNGLVVARASIFAGDYDAFVAELKRRIG